MKSTALMLILALLAARVGAEENAAAPLRIVVLGDSTVCDYPAESATRGWGQFLAEGFKQPVKIRNLAASGRSTKTFIKEGRLKKALDEPSDFALIQFGHNDSHGAGRPEATDAATDYPEFLKTYIESFKKAGSQPILVTPMHRRTFKDGKLTEELRPYAESMKAVAAEMHVPVVDLFTLSGELFEKLGDAASADLNCAPKDRTHFSEKGARAMAGLVLQELKKTHPRLAAALK